ncbi:MAG: adenylyltransferase/cytidyltransferase family protein [Nanoarchaeota archaeon]|nr:adenylyltransferase/cytidyltransferase family protein [Nanoarchaeota archaeon]
MMEKGKSTKPIIVYTAGTWDLFHIGHLNLFKRSKELGTKLIVGVSTDELVESYKKSKPIIPYDDRVELIKSCRFVDEVVKQEKLLDIKQMEDLGIDVLTIGNDWESKYLEGLEWAKHHPKVKLVYFPYTSKISSTLLKNKLITFANSGRKETPLTENDS